MVADCGLGAESCFWQLSEQVLRHKGGLHTWQQGLMSHQGVLCMAYRCLAKHGYGLQESIVAGAALGKNVGAYCSFKYLRCFFQAF
jgi:hypothetical protein